MLRRFVFFVHVLMYINLWPRDTYGVPLGPSCPRHNANGRNAKEQTCEGAKTRRSESANAKAIQLSGSMISNLHHSRLPCKRITHYTSVILCGNMCNCVLWSFYLLLWLFQDRMLLKTCSQCFKHRAFIIDKSTSRINGTKGIPTSILRWKPICRCVRYYRNKMSLT